jgi:predicted  nucleic acid-binding Zn-ribbon protein
MEGKMFELMTKMYSDLTTRLDKMDDKISSIDKKLDSKADKSDIVHIENKLDNTTKALFDGYNQVCDKVVAVENAVSDLSSKVEKQEVEIKVIKGGK